jgi:glycosyltransferase involved in cell wall biosynthesis
MREAMLIDALRPAASVDVAVIPVAGTGSLDWARGRADQVVEVAPVTGDDGRAHVTAQLADARLRERLARTEPLPLRARLAPATLAPGLLGQLDRPPDIVLGVRLGLAPLAVETARRCGAARVVVDSDDDDEGLLRSVGQPADADAHHRLASAWLPEADTVLTAAGPDAAALARRHGLTDVRVVPNAVALPARTVAPPGADRLLYVGNLTYRPNIDAATILARDVLPRVRRARPHATADLVGPHDDRLADGPAGSGFRLTGRVPTVTPWYTRSDVVVIPLRVGSGTRIKVLEAFAHRRPVVATATAVAGLDVVADAHLRLADGPVGLAAAVVDVLRAPVEATPMVERAARLVADHHTPEVVGPLARAAVMGHDGPVTNGPEATRDV